MNAEIRPIRTAAEEQLKRAFAAAKATLPGHAIQPQRDRAFRAFEATGLPSRRSEQWKYTDLSAFMREAKPLAAPPDDATKERAAAMGRALAGTEARRVVVVDGHFAPELSDLADLEPGFSISSLADALLWSVKDVVACVRAARAEDPAINLNTALMGDGVVISVAAGVEIKRPVHVVFAYCGETEAAIYTRSLVMLGAGARLTLFETHEGPDGVAYQENSVVDLSLGDGAVLDRVKLGFEGARAIHVSTLNTTLGKDAAISDCTLAVGGAMVRNQIFARCAGTGGSLGFSGASLVDGQRHADTTLVLDHAVGGCQSRELYKSVLKDDARTVFQGKIVVRPDAQKTDGRMMTQALLLSETAEADAKPELEIFADDVQCGHGATTCALDEELKFYLEARGIPADEAEALLVEAFIGEVIDGVAHEGARDALRAVVAAKLKSWA
jgi:Fe-S cluster assembly protein SufD